MQGTLAIWHLYLGFELGKQALQQSIGDPVVMVREKQVAIVAEGLAPVIIGWHESTGHNITV